MTLISFLRINRDLTAVIILVLAIEAWATNSVGAYFTALSDSFGISSAIIIMATSAVSSIYALTVLAHCAIIIACRVSSSAKA